ncbi:MAG: RNA-binding S4 domain-containing protein [Muribaculaceae bacterium]|nr:RNA-binding S4 domain-containing protein [Muribaculaceae bacterium]
MESNEKKGKRPRIGARPISAENPEMRQSTSQTDYNTNQSTEAGDESRQQPSGYQPRQGGYNQNYNRQGGYQPRQQGGYNRQSGYQPRQQGGYNRQGGYNQQGGYQPRQGGYRPHVPQTEGHPTEGSATDNTSSTDSENTNLQTGYQPRQQSGYNRQTGYQPRQQGGYNRQGGYQPRQGGYNQQGGYQPRQQGGYQPRQQGGYQPRQQGGYQPRQGGYNQQGGYQPRQQGGYNNRQGGYNQQGGNRQSGYNRQGGKQAPRQNQYGMPQGGRSFTPRPKRIQYEVEMPDPNEQIRLNKYMANAGICSRREADEYIQQGLIKVNGEVVKELGTKINHSDVVEYNDKVVTLESKCYILLNKPKDCVTTSDDPNGRLTVLDLIKGACEERVYPVGRLDRNTTGVLLLTNDGDLASKLTHPKFIKKKIYHVWTDKDISEDDMQRIADGIELEDGPIHADAISYATETDRNQAGIEIHSGRNRIVRRIFESLGYHVTKLDRVYFAGLTKKNLPRGRWRYLTQEEVNFLKMGSFE